MNTLKNHSRPIGAAVFGLLVALLVGTFIIKPDHDHPSASHPIGATQGEEVHVHGDFRMYIGDERIRFTDDKYQSSSATTHHASLHFHDGNDEVIHRHADGVTLVEFFDSIGMTLDNECLILDTGTQYCTNATGTLMLIVNNERTLDIENYIFAEEDRILIYYGDPTNPNIRDYTVGVTDLACVYSGTCPERGTPPTESCGLTCEVANASTYESGSLLHTIKDFFTWR
jgi:hypothetical protein